MSSSPNETNDLPDLETIREKYRVERDKRLRSDGSSQFHELAREGSHNDIDPYVEPGFTREPIEQETEVVVIGGGFGGMLMSVRLRDQGIEDFRIIEAGGDFGGTWYWNRYPGVQCDVESYIYMPLLEELGAIPTEKYAHGPEIFAHAQKIGRHFDLYDRALFQTQVRALRWDEDEQRWFVTTSRDDVLRARFVCMATGPYSTPKLPGIPGAADFAGHTFHTSRWDYDYTGGDTTGGLTKLAGKRVGVIGTGATAIQAVPHLGRDAGEVFVFQRTPSTVDVRDNAPTEPGFTDTLEPGWQRKRMDNFNALMDGLAQEEDLIGDRWTELTLGLYEELGRHPNPAELSEAEMGLIAERVDLKKMERIRGRVEEVVEDPVTAAALKPWYRYLCKRPCFHDEYLPTFNRPNVHLIDTDGRGVDRVTTKGVVANGQEYGLDCLIFATGFDVTTNYTRRVGYDIEGRDGLKLSEKWRDRTSTFQSFHTRGFPNCFFMMGFQAGLTPNIPHTIEEQSQHLSWLIRQMKERGLTTVESSEAAEADWCAMIDEGSGFSQLQQSCTPGYFNDEGKVGETAGWLAGFHPEGSEGFFTCIREWRAKGDLEGLETS